jgi:DNA-binding GntR family transcriptional regulator
MELKMDDKSPLFVPIYKKLFDQYRDDIRSYRLQPGHRVHSITEMQGLHGVARETAKRVLNMLAEEGYIIQRRGKGSFVSDLRPKQKIWGLVFPFHSIQYENLIAEVSRQAETHGRHFSSFCDYNNYEEEGTTFRFTLPKDH